MLLTHKEKEELVRDLLEKGYTIRKISEQAHVSFSFISEVKRKMIGEEKERGIKKNKKSLSSLSVTSQAFKLFLKGKSLVDVSIILDISKDEVAQTYSDYLILKDMREVAFILQEYRNNLSDFIKLFRYLKKNNVKWIDIKIAIDNKNKIDILQQQREKLQKEVQSILEDRKYYLRDLENIKREYYK